MTWNIPNILTVARIIMSVILFVMISLYDHSAQWTESLMACAFVLFLFCVLTDFLDGAIARAMNQVTTFGRIADPFVDKILIVGAYIIFASPIFANEDPAMIESFIGGLPHWMAGKNITCVQTWMVLVILAREFLVSAIRGYSESQGIEYPSSMIGKVKMFIQSFTVGAIIFCLAWGDGVAWCCIIRTIAVWISVLATAASGIIYISKSKVLFQSQAKEGDG